MPKFFNVVGQKTCRRRREHRAIKLPPYINVSHDGYLTVAFRLPVKYLLFQAAARPKQASACLPFLRCPHGAVERT